MNDKIVDDMQSDATFNSGLSDGFCSRDHISKQQKIQIIDQIVNHGKSPKQFANRLQVKVSLINYWRWRYKDNVTGIAEKDVFLGKDDLSLFNLNKQQKMWFVKQIVDGDTAKRLAKRFNLKRNLINLWSHRYQKEVKAKYFRNQRSTLSDGDISNNIITLPSLMKYKFGSRKRISEIACLQNVEHRKTSVCQMVDKQNGLIFDVEGFHIIASEEGLPEFPTNELTLNEMVIIIK